MIYQSRRWKPSSGVAKPGLLAGFRFIAIEATNHHDKAQAGPANYWLQGATKYTLKQPSDGWGFPSVPEPEDEPADAGHNCQEKQRFSHKGL